MIIHVVYENGVKHGVAIDRLPARILENVSHDGVRYIAIVISHSNV